LKTWSRQVKCETGCPHGTPFRILPACSRFSTQATPPRDWYERDKSRGSGGWPPALYPLKTRNSPFYGTSSGGSNFPLNASFVDFLLLACCSKRSFSSGSRHFVCCTDLQVADSKALTCTGKRSSPGPFLLPIETFLCLSPFCAGHSLRFRIG